jgi:hypothetical protein
MTYLNPPLFSTGTLEIRLSNPLTNLRPQLPTLPLSLLLDALRSDFRLRAIYIMERHPALHFRGRVPCSFNDVRFVMMVRV